MINIQQEVINGNINPYELLDLWNEKPLDQSDIESLGWDHDQTTKDGACFYYGTLMSIKQYMLNCSEARKDNYINLEITDVTSLQNMTQLFEGTIKNKSELIKLMQQLNIK